MLEALRRLAALDVRMTTMDNARLLRGEELLRAGSVPRYVRVCEEVRHARAMAQLEKLLTHAAKG